MRTGVSNTGSQSSFEYGYYKNASLFADHFIETHLLEMPEWRDSAGLDEAFDAVLPLYRKHAARLANANESQTEDDFIRPVLNLLWGADCYDVQAYLPVVEERRYPDYALFRTPDDRDAAAPLKRTPDYWRDVPCLADAKQWSSSLDRVRGHNDSPSAQVAEYLWRSRVRWGILTNGRVWRLFEQDKARTGGIHFEVYLEEILQSGNKDAFRWFYHFFRRAAYVPDDSGLTFLDKVYQGSVTYATEIGNRLKDSVYDALRILMNGFLAHPDNRLDTGNPEHLRRAHDNALIVLYRLLFILYAEDRDLLDCANRHYSPYCLRDLHREINKRARNGSVQLVRANGIWTRLLNLFRIIDEGIPEGQIPAYNGGLFTPDNHPAVAYQARNGTPRLEIGDYYIAQAVDLLAYEREPRAQSGSRDIDYASLDVQHLGRIYEGLLELVPEVAHVPVVEVAESGKSVFKPASEVPNPRPFGRRPPLRVEPGEVYLVTSRGERKATGSYYTPKYIVDYIVDNTLGPLVEDAAKRVAELRPGVDAQIAKLAKARAEWEASEDPNAAHQIDGLERRMEEVKSTLFEPYLSLRVLDPAMGSGHFLVGAADFLSLAMATDPGLLPPSEVDGEEPQAYYKRLVVERCLYGVDLNPLAVELAKLSLWLHTVSRNKALSFLDHHIRCGNSLIGARVEEDLCKAVPEFNERGRRTNVDSKQLVLGFAEALTGRHLQYFLDSFAEIMRSMGGDVRAQHTKDVLYRQMDLVRDKYRAVANCWIAPFFGVKVRPEQYEQAVRALKKDEAGWHHVATRKWFREVQAAADEKRFFHWEIEFPEVFFDPTGFKPPEERGFHAVVGNPPWLGLRTGEIQDDLLSYVRQRFLLATGQFDLSALFLELAERLTGGCSELGEVVPKRLATNESFADLRAILAGTRSLRSALDLGVAFDGVDNDALIVVSSAGGRPVGSATVGTLTPRTGLVASQLDAALLRYMPFGVFPLNSPPAAVALLGTIAEAGVLPLAECASIVRGAECGMNHPAISRVGTASSLRLVDHLDVRRYNVQHDGWYLSPTRAGNAVAKDVNIYTFTPKLLIRFLASDLVVARDDVGYASTNLVYHVACSCDTAFLCALLCSRLLGFWYRTAFQNEEVKFPHVQKSHLLRLPIRRISFTTPEDERAALVAQARVLYDRYLSSSDAGQLVAFTREQLAHDPERADVLHDLLAFLAERMIDLNKSRQAETAGFLAWLERSIGVKVDELSNKTRLRAYDESDLPGVLDVLKSNAKKLKVDPAARAFQEVLEQELAASVARLGPVKSALALTDRLIDVIVYQLYGLTEDEIAVVESSGL